MGPRDQHIVKTDKNLMCFNDEFNFHRKNCTALTNKSCKTKCGYVVLLLWPGLLRPILSVLICPTETRAQILVNLRGFFSRSPVCQAILLSLFGSNTGKNRWRAKTRFFTRRSENSKKLPGTQNLHKRTQMSPFRSVFGPTLKK